MVYRLRAEPPRRSPITILISVSVYFYVYCQKEFTGRPPIFLPSDKCQVSQAEAESEDRDRGGRGAVTGGKQMDGFVFHVARG
jgi:hypothetical protein